MKPRFRCHPCTFRHFDSHRLPDPHLTHQVRLFPRRSPQRSSANAAVGGLEPPPRRATPKGLPSSSTQHRLQKLYLPPASLSVRDTPFRTPQATPQPRNRVPTPLEAPRHVAVLSAPL